MLRAGVRKPPREETALGDARQRSGHYGDLVAADEAREHVREDGVQWRAAIWLRSKRLTGFTDEDCCAIWMGDWIFERPPSLAVEKPLRKPSDLPDRGAAVVMTCRS